MADRIKLFQFIQKFHRAMGICPCEPKQQQHSTDWTKTIFLVSFTQFLFTTVAFFMFMAKSMFDYGFIFYLLISIINGIAIYLIFIWQSGNTLKLIKNCEGFIEKRPDSTAAYIELIGKIELFNKFICYGLCTTGALCLLMAGPFTLLRYYLFNMGEDSFYLFLPAWFPFDWKTPVGYLMAWLAQCAGGTVTASTNGQFLNLVFGSCWLFIFITEDITQHVIAFNIAAKTKTSHGNQTELTKHFCDMVQIFSNAKQCIMEFNQMIKYSLFTFFSWDILGVSSLLVTIQFELWADDSKLFEIALLLLVLIWMILFIFLLCEPGERIINRFVKFCDELNRCDWYLLSIKLQRWYIIFVSDTQNPIKVLSYANITCERETSKKMINTAFSYFMTFRRFKP